MILFCFVHFRINFNLKLVSTKVVYILNLSYILEWDLKKPEQPIRAKPRKRERGLKKKKI